MQTTTIAAKTATIAPPAPKAANVLVPAKPKPEAPEIIRCNNSYDNLVTRMRHDIAKRREDAVKPMQERKRELYKQILSSKAGTPERMIAERELTGLTQILASVQAQYVQTEQQAMQSLTENRERELDDIRKRLAAVAQTTALPQPIIERILARTIEEAAAAIAVTIKLAIEALARMIRGMVQLLTGGQSHTEDHEMPGMSPG